MTPSHPPAPLPRSLILLLALASGQAVAGTFYAQPLLDAIAASFGIPEGSAGAVVAVTQGGYAVGLVLLVPLGDVVERRRLILLQLVLGALALAAAGAVGSGGLLLVAMAGVGLFAVVIQLVVVHAASLTPEAQRGEVVGAVTGGVVLGILQARTLAGPVAELGSWRTVYLTAAGLTLLVTLVLLRRLPTGEHDRTGITYGAVLRSLPALYAGERSLRVRGALALLVFAALSVVWGSLVLPLTAPPHSLSRAAVGLFGLTAIAGAVAARRAGRLADCGRGEHTTGLALGLLVVAWLPLALIEWSLAAVAVGLVLVDLAVQAVHVTNQSMIYAARPEARSRLAGAYMVFYSVGIAGGSVASTATYAAAGWTAVCALGATISLAALAMWIATTPRSAWKGDRASRCLTGVERGRPRRAPFPRNRHQRRAGRAGGKEKPSTPWARRHDLPLRRDIGGPAVETAPETAVARVRALSEALANAERHAGARRILVTLRAEDRRLVLTIADDGCGFDADRAPGRAGVHFGLSLMRERAEGAGGELHVASSPGEGTRVPLRLPVGPPGGGGRLEANA